MRAPLKLKTMHLLLCFAFILVAVKKEGLNELSIYLSNQLAFQGMTKIKNGQSVLVEYNTIK